MSDGPLERRVAAALRAWHRFKRSHPGLAYTLAPILRRLWELALRRRASWARLSEVEAWQGQLDGASMPVVAAPTDPAQIIDDPVAQVAGRVEYAFGIPGLGVFLVGWLFDPANRVRRMTAHVGSRESGNLMGHLARIARPDVAEVYRSWGAGAHERYHGFAGLARFDGASREAISHALRWRLWEGGDRSWSIDPRPVVYDAADPLPAIRTMLSIVPLRNVKVLDDHLGPAISALWTRGSGDDWVVEDVGSLPTDPTVSVIVPIYRRYDFIEYQLAAFADDADFASAELIYVVDDPSIAEEVSRLCRSIQPVLRVPHRVVLCESNNGFAGATNIGARVASAPVLLLLNSDVIPIRSGWLGQMLECHAALPDDGVLGTRLLFHDGSLQHDGMRFAEEAWFPGVWLNQHPGKGLPPTPAGPGAPVRVDAVTAACMMLSRERYEDAGGLDEGYIIGDFEDSDLCLKLREGGHHSYVAPWIPLYHLERQSQALIGERHWRQSLTLYNAWRHTQRWSHLLGSPSQKGQHG